MRIKALFFIIISLIAVLGFFSWFNSSWSEYLDCIDNKSSTTDTCLDTFLEQSPPIQEAKDIESACDQSDLDCLQKAGEIIIENKIESYAEEK